MNTRIVIEHAADWVVVLCILSLFAAAIIEVYKSLFPPMKEPETPFENAERAMFDRGYVLVGVWNIKDLQRYAGEMGVYFTRVDYGNIIKLVKDNFDEKEGITKDTIVSWMKYYVQHHTGKDFTIPYLGYTESDFSGT